MALLTPPHSGKVATEHYFETHSDDGTADPALFVPAKEAGCASPTDKILFPLRGIHTVPGTPSSAAPATPPLKRRKTDPEDDETPPRHPFKVYDSPATQIQSKRWSSPHVEQRSLVLAPIKDDSTRVHKPQRHQRAVSPASEADRQLVLSFLEDFKKGVVDFGQEFWFVMRHNYKSRGSNTWLVPQTPPRPSSKQSKPRQRKAPRPLSEDMRGAAISKSPNSPARGNARRATSTPTQQQKPEARSTRNPANKPLVSKNYRDWPDYSPTYESMYEPEKIARNMPAMSGRKDLSNDPLRNELHPAEIIAAHQAGMDCARYLCTKRSVFVGFVKHLRYMAGKYQLSPEDQKKGLKSWNKTAAQGCSAIDVNKTSTLFGHFWEPIGWFDKNLFKKYIDAEHVYFPEFDKDGNLRQ